MKRGIELQFHWIFIIIAGGVILLFFFSIANKQRQLSEKKVAITIAKNLETVLTAALQSPGTAQIITMPKTGIQFHCNTCPRAGSATTGCIFKIGNYENPFQEKIIFAPRELTEHDMLFWTLDWKTPFRATNFLFITNPKIQYIIVSNDDPTSEKLMRNLIKISPKELMLKTIKNTEIPSLVNEGIPTKFVFLNLNTLPELGLSFERAKNIDGISIGRKTVDFLVKQKRSFATNISVQYTEGDLPAIAAAMFANDAAMYDCGLKKAYGQATYVAKVINQRRQELQKSIEPTSQLARCIPAYERNDLSKITNILESLSNGGTGALKSEKDTLELANKDLVKLSCPQLY